MAGTAAAIAISHEEQEILRKILRSQTLGAALQERTRIVLAASEGLTNVQIESQFGLEEHRVACWRTRFRDEYEHWQQLDAALRPAMSKKLILQWLVDRPGRGRKPRITPEQKALILAVAIEPPSKSGYPHIQEWLSAYPLEQSIVGERSDQTRYHRLHSFSNRVGFFKRHTT